MIRILNEKVLDTVITGAASVVVNTKSMHGASFQVNATVDSTAKTAAAGVLATLVVQDITYTAKAVTSGLDSIGNSMSIAYTTGGTAGAEIVTVVGFAVNVQIASGVSTATQVVAAITASVAASVFLTAAVTGTGSNAQTAPTGPTFLAGGVDSTFSVANDTITIPAHGFFTGQVIQLTKSGAAFPGGLAASTNYYIYVVSSGVIALFDTEAHALAATQVNGVPSGTGLIDITSDASSGSTITVTPTGVSGVSWKLQKSVDYDPISKNGNWIDCVSGESNTQVTNTITTTGSTYASLVQCYFPYTRVLFASSAGSTAVQVYVCAKSV